MYYIYNENHVVHANSKHDAKDTVSNTNHEEPEFFELIPVTVKEVMAKLNRQYNRYFKLFCSRRAGIPVNEIMDYARKHADIMWG